MTEMDIHQDGWSISVDTGTIMTGVAVPTAPKQPGRPWPKGGAAIYTERRVWMAKPCVESSRASTTQCGFKPMSKGTTWR